MSSNGTIMRYESKFAGSGPKGGSGAREKAIRAARAGQIASLVSHHEPAEIKLAKVSIQSNRRYDHD